MIFMLAIDQEYDELDMAIRLFQNTMMRARVFFHTCGGWHRMV
ncbi:MAG: hypothetical protein WDN26_16845 [Chitinophagaceae bacterium]